MHLKRLNLFSTAHPQPLFCPYLYLSTLFFFMKFLCFLLTLLWSAGLYAQSVRIASSPGQADPSAGLDVDFNDRGLLLPRLTTTQRNAIANPADGLQIFNTTSQCMEVFISNSWFAVACPCQNFPNAQFSFSPANPGAGNSVSFSPQQSGLQYQWLFASGTPASSSQANPSVTWANAGTYSVVLQVTDNQGCAASDTQNVVVSSCPTGSQTFTANGILASGSIQSFTVPACVTSVTVEAWGAQGGSTSNTNGGLGAYIKGAFSVSGGEVLRVLVGQQGEAGSSGHGNCGGGGGGSFVTRSNNQPMVVAGGGGGAGTASIISIRTPDPGQSGNSGTAGKGNGMPGGTGGNAAPGVCGNCGATNGAGLQSNSQAYGSTYGTSAIAFTNGGGGSTSSSGYDGGFGGGGAGAFGAGGGGGYSGGGSGNYSGTTDNSGGGGGGSFNGGTNPSNQAGVRSGNGQVIISW